MTLTKREVQAAFDKHRIGRRYQNNDLAMVLMQAAIEFLPEHPEWLERNCSASTITELQILLTLTAEGNNSLVAACIAQSDRIQGMVRDASGSLIQTAALMESLKSGVTKSLHGVFIRKLDQEVCALREQPLEAELGWFTTRGASAWVISRRRQGTLTFRQVLERAPQLLILPAANYDW